MQRQFSSAMDEVFASGDLVYLFKDCFTLRKCALNRKFLRFARRKQMDVVPVAVRANVDPFKYQKAIYGRIPFKVCDIDWPARLDPTVDLAVDFDILSHFIDPEKSYKQMLHRKMELHIMIKMLDTHAADIRRLKIRMSLAVEMVDGGENDSLDLNRFMKALAKCTAMETLTIVQTDHVAQDASLTTVQCRLFDIIKTMHQLKVLDFCGNMTIDAVNATLDDTNNTQNQLTMIDYLPPSLCELVVRDGQTPRMYKWIDFYGFSAGLKLAMCNAGGRFPLLRTISLPSSFWSLMPHEFGGFVLYLNSKHITTIGFSDPFKLNHQSKLGEAYGHFTHLPKPKYGLHYLIVSLLQDMVIDIRGGDDAERAARIEWAMTIASSSVIQPILRSDGAEYTTITMHKLYNGTVRVLI